MPASNAWTHRRVHYWRTILASMAEEHGHEDGLGIAASELTPPGAQREALVLAGCLVGVAVVGFVDYVTGYEIRAYPLYFVPIGFAAWRLPRTLAMLLPFCSALAWVSSNALAGAHYSSPYIWIFNTGSQLTAFGFVGYLISELTMRLSAEENLSRVDPLTGLANGRAFFERAGLLLAIARRSSFAVTLAYLDLDNFKAVNDRFGHAEGDRALRSAAEVLKRHSRASDMVARLGGDEFLMLLFDTGFDAARVSLERLRDLTASAMREHDWPITISVGALTYERAPATLDEAVRGADSLMYRAKKSGRDRVYVEIVQEPSVSAR